MRSSQDGAEVPGEKGARGAWASLAQTEEEDRSLHLFALKPTDGCSRCGAFLYSLPALPTGSQPRGAL